MYNTCVSVNGYFLYMYISTIQGSPNSISETPSISMLHLLTVVVTIKSIPLHLYDYTRFRTLLAKYLIKVKSRYKRNRLIGPGEVVSLVTLTGLKQTCQ